MKARLYVPALLVIALLAGACAGRPTVPVADPPFAGAIAAPDTFSAEVGTRVLQSGGNAVDAAIAVALTLAVTQPEAGNLGGGGFLLAWVDGEAAFMDYRETAPAAARRDMYLDAQGNVIDGSSLTGHRASGVPGTVAGLWEAHQRFGRLEWRDLVQPAIDLADHGFLVPAQLASNVREEWPRTGEVAGFSRYFGGLRADEVFRQPDLADTLRRIQADGPAGFYRGPIAAMIVAEVSRGGGLITAQDLADYRPVWRAPLRAGWRGYEVLTAPPPSSGGIAVLQLLGMKDLLTDDFAGLGHNSPRYVHLTAEMEKRVFADRAEYLGDPDFVEVPVAALLSHDYLARRAAGIDRSAISPIPSVQPGLEPRHTTHFSIVDRWGNAVSNTYTLNTNFGSGVVVDGAGFLLNNEMDDFAIKPGQPNYYGVVGSTANEVQPHKRMLSSMTPTVLLEGGKVRAVVGSPGGSTIITSVYQALVNVLDFGMSAEEAVGATRFHHQLLPPDLVTYSPGRPLPEDTIAALRAIGYRPQPHDWEFGDVQLIVRDGDTWQAASDPRGRGTSRVLH